MNRKYDVELTLEKVSSLRDINDGIIEHFFKKLDHEFLGVRCLLEVNDAQIIHALWRRGWKFNKVDKQWGKV